MMDAKRITARIFTIIIFLPCYKWESHRVGQVGVGAQPAINAVSAGIEIFQFHFERRGVRGTARDHTAIMTVSVVNGSIDPKEVSLGTGPPTREELLAHYPAQFTWTELKTFMNAGYGPEIW